MRLDASLVWQYIYVLVGLDGLVLINLEIVSVVMYRQENKNNLGNSEGF